MALYAKPYDIDMNSDLGEFRIWFGKLMNVFKALSDIVKIERKCCLGF